MGFAEQLASLTNSTNELIATVKGQYDKWNRDQATFKKKVWDDVGGALGQFDKVFYIDSNNGSDSNIGSSTQPFKTIQKAVSKTPISGKLTCRFNSGIYNISGLSINNKTVLFESLDNGKISLVHSVEVKDDFSELKPTYINNGKLLFAYDGDKDFEFVPDDRINNLPWKYRTLFLMNGDSTLSIFNGNVELKEGQVLCYGQNYLGGSTNLYIKNSSLKANVSATLLTLSFGSSAVFRFQDNETDATIEMVAGLVKDTNGNPRNILSNIIL